MGEPEPVDLRHAIGPATGDLDRARRHFAQRRWAEAHGAFSRADHTSRLAGEDLESLATSAFLVGLEDEYVEALERAHLAYLDRGAVAQAVHCAYWIGLHFALRGDTGQANGWVGRGWRLLEGEPETCTEAGYLLIPAAVQQMRAGESEAAYATAGRAISISEQSDDRELAAAGILLQGRALLQQRQLAQGLALLDEAMVCVRTGGVSPISTGRIYCSVIEGCVFAYIWERAAEWTEVLARWCDDQPDMMAFSGACRLHRAEVLELRGAWVEAIREATRAVERGGSPQVVAAAYCQLGDIHRLRGELDAAERAYVKAGALGHQPQPGLGLLRLAQGRSEAALAALRNAVAVAGQRWERARLLAAHLEALLACGEIDEAGRVCADLEALADGAEADVLRAFALDARGALELAGDRAATALVALGRAAEIWQGMRAPYRAARTRTSMSRAYAALGDGDASALERDAALAAFQELGARLDVERLGAARGTGAAKAALGLSARELEVLRLIAGGETNRSIADMLFISERTVERHVSNIFGKLNVGSRAAATARAYTDKLL